MSNSLTFDKEFDGNKTISDVNATIYQIVANNKGYKMEGEPKLRFKTTDGKTIGIVKFKLSEISQ